MMMVIPLSKALGIAALGGLALWLWRADRLDEFLPGELAYSVDRFLDATVGDLLPDDVDKVQPSGEAGEVELQPENVSAVLPGADLPTGENIYERFLVDEWAQVSPWGRDNWRWVAAMIWQESGGRVSAIGDRDVEGASHGLMQVRLTTAQELAARGYNRHEPSSEVLRTAAGGIYFGTSYLQYLSELRADRDWITRAYNGGPGWESNGSRARTMTARYLSEVRHKYQSLYEGVTV